MRMNVLSHWRILAAAESLFRQHGFEGASVERVMRAEAPGAGCHMPSLLPALTSVNGPGARLLLIAPHVSNGVSSRQQGQQILRGEPRRGVRPFEHSGHEGTLV